MVSTRLHEKPWNRIDFESIFVAGGQIELAELQRAAYTCRTAFVIYAQVHCTIAQLQQCHLDKQLQLWWQIGPKNSCIVVYIVEVIAKL